MNEIMTINSFDFEPKNSLYQQVTRLKSSALDEYKAARILLSADMLHQAAVHINNCIEKEMKAFLKLENVKYKPIHDTIKLSKLFETHVTDFASHINQEFLTVSSAIYQSTYPDDLPGGYKFVIAKNLFLVELDQTYIYLENLSTPYGLDENGNRKTPFEFNKHVDVIQKDNHMLGKADKIVLQYASQKIYEYKIHEKIGEVTLKYSEIPDDPTKFIYP